MNLNGRLYVAEFAENSIEIIKENSLGLEINSTCISDSLEAGRRSKLIDEILGNISKSNAEKIIMHGPFTEIHPAAIDKRIREMGLERLNEAYLVYKEISEKTGKKLQKMVVHSGWLPFIYFKSYHEEEATKFWKEFMKDKPDDFEIAIENVLDDEPYMLMNLVGRIDDPRVGLTLDIGHANAAMIKGSSLLEWAMVMGPKIKHFHLHDNMADGDKHLALGKGNIELKKLFSIIENYVGKDVTFTVESTDAKSSIEWLKENGFI